MTRSKRSIEFLLSNWLDSLRKSLFISYSPVDCVWLNMNYRAVAVLAIGVEVGKEQKATLRV